MHEPQVSAFSCFPYDIQEYHLLFSFEQSMNLNFSFYPDFTEDADSCTFQISTDSKMTGLCFVCFDSKLFIILHFSLSPNYYMSVSLSVHLSVCLSTYLLISI